MFFTSITYHWFFATVFEINIIIFALLNEKLNPRESVQKHVTDEEQKTELKSRSKDPELLETLTTKLCAFLIYL